MLRCPGHRKLDHGPCGYPPSKNRDDGLCARHGERADAEAWARRYLTGEIPESPDALEMLADLLDPRAIDAALAEATDPRRIDTFLRESAEAAEQALRESDALLSRLEAAPVFDLASRRRRPDHGAA